MLRPDFACLALGIVLIAPSLSQAQILEPDAREYRRSLPERRMAGEPRELSGRDPLGPELGQSLSSLAAAPDPCIECNIIYSGGGDGSLYAIDTEARTSVLIGRTSTMFDIAITAEGRMFGMSGGLQEIDACTARTTTVGSVGGNGLGASLTEPLLYAQGPPLSSIDTSAGFLVNTIGGAIGAGPPGWCGFSSGDLALSPIDGKLYSSLGCSGGDSLVTLDPLTGDMTELIGPVRDAGGAPFGSLFGLAFDTTGTLWVGQSSGSHLLRVDPSTALVLETVPISGGYAGTFGMASIPCPGACVTCSVTAASPYECEGVTTRVRLEGSGGSPDGPVLFEWTGPCAIDDPSAADTMATCAGTGEQRFTLRVTLDEDGDGLAGSLEPNSECELLVTVQDSLEPGLVIPADQVLECEGDGADVTLVASASDECGAVSLSNSRTGSGGDASGRYPLGETVVAFEAVDEAGNSTSGLTRVLVQDTAPPVLVGVPPSTTLSCIDEVIPAIVTAEDGCDSAPCLELFETRIDGPCPDSFQLEQTWTARDCSGNMTSASRLLTVEDTLEPTLSAALLPLAPGEPSSACSAPTSRAFRISCEAEDDCDPAVEIEARLVVLNQDVDASGCVERRDEIPVSCGETVLLRLLAPPCPASGPTSAMPVLSTGPMGLQLISGTSFELLVTATDACGNEASSSVDPSTDCEWLLDDGTCCPALAAPAFPPCSAGPCGS